MTRAPRIRSCLVPLFSAVALAVTGVQPAHAASGLLMYTDGATNSHKYLKNPGSGCYR